jgi:hypothetical protein
VTIREYTLASDDVPPPWCGTLESMATLQQRVRAFLSGPQGKRLIAEGQRQLAKPENQRRLRQVINRFRSRR